MTTQVGTIVTLVGHTTPFYPTGPTGPTGPGFVLDSMSANKKWNYDDGIVTAGSFVVGVAYQIVSIGTTDFTLYGASSNTIGQVFVATANPPGTQPLLSSAFNQIGMYPYMVGTGTGTATAAGIQLLAQPLPAAGQGTGGSWPNTPFNYTPSTAEQLPSGPSGPETQGSPNVSLNFVVEILYPATTGPTGSGPLGPNFAYTVEQFRQLAVTGPTYAGFATGPTGATINSAFGLALS